MTDTAYELAIEDAATRFYAVVDELRVESLDFPTPAGSDFLDFTLWVRRLAHDLELVADELTRHLP